jgi:hypothetical protein
MGICGVPHLLKLLLHMISRHFCSSPSKTCYIQIIQLSPSKKEVLKWFTYTQEKGKKRRKNLSSLYTIAQLFYFYRAAAANPLLKALYIRRHLRSSILIFVKRTRLGSYIDTAAVRTTERPKAFEICLQHNSLLCV